MVLTEAQVAALEQKRDDQEARGEVETVHPGDPGAQDTFYVGTLKGVGRIYQQAFIDTYSKWAAAKLYAAKTAITAADLLKDRVLPFFEQQRLPLLRLLTDRGTEFCGRHDEHPLSAFSGCERRRPHEDEGEEPANERHLRPVPQDGAAGVLSGGLPQAPVYEPGAVAGGPRCVAGHVQ